MFPVTRGLCLDPLLLLIITSHFPQRRAQNSREQEWVSERGESRIRFLSAPAAHRSERKVNEALWVLRRVSGEVKSLRPPIHIDEPPHVSLPIRPTHSFVNKPPYSHSSKKITNTITWNWDQKTLLSASAVRHTIISTTTLPMHVLGISSTYLLIPDSTQHKP